MCATKLYTVMKRVSGSGDPTPGIRVCAAGKRLAAPMVLRWEWLLLIWGASLLFCGFSPPVS